jgi:hypothetical protein
MSLSGLLSRAATIVRSSAWNSLRISARARRSIMMPSMAARSTAPQSRSRRSASGAESSLSATPAPSKKARRSASPPAVAPPAGRGAGAAGTFAGADAST